MSFLDVLLALSVRIFWSMWISIGFALLFNTPRRALWITGLLGGVGWGIKFVLLGTIMPEQIVITSFLGACAVGSWRSILRTAYIRLLSCLPFRQLSI